MSYRLRLNLNVRLRLNLNVRLRLNLSRRLRLNLSYRLRLNLSCRLRLNLSYRLRLNWICRLRLNLSRRLSLNLSRRLRLSLSCRLRLNLNCRLRLNLNCRLRLNLNCRLRLNLNLSCRLNFDGLNFNRSPSSAAQHVQHRLRVIFFRLRHERHQILHAVNLRLVRNGFGGEECFRIHDEEIIHIACRKNFRRLLVGKFLFKQIGFLCFERQFLFDKRNLRRQFLSFKQGHFFRQNLWNKNFFAHR